MIFSHTDACFSTYFAIIMEEENFYDFVDFDEFDSQNLQEDEGSNISSRKSSISQGNRPSKRIKTRVVKGRPKQSFVWNHFITIDNSNFCQVSVPVSDKNPNRKCNYKIANSLTTTNMITNLRKVYNIFNPTEQEKVNNFL